MIKIVECTSGLLVLESSTEDLHAEEGKDEDEEDEEDQQGVDGGDRVDEGLDQVAHGRPVSGVLWKMFKCPASY